MWSACKCCFVTSVVINLLKYVGLLISKQNMNKITVQNYTTSSVITEHTVREKETTVKLNVKFST